MKNAACFRGISENGGIRRRPSETHRTVQKPKLCTVRCIRLSKHGWSNVVTASEAPHCGASCPRRQTAGSSFALCTNHSRQYPATGSYMLYAANVRRPDIRLCFRQAQGRLQRRASGAVTLCPDSFIDSNRRRQSACLSCIYNVRASLSRKLSCACPGKSQSPDPARNEAIRLKGVAYTAGTGAGCRAALCLWNC